MPKHKPSVTVLPHKEYLKRLEEDKDGLLVCSPGSKCKTFPDDLFGTCEDCRQPIHYRPYNAKAAHKICVKCALRRAAKGIPS